MWCRQRELADRVEEAVQRDDERGERADLDGVARVDRLVAGNSDGRSLAHPLRIGAARVAKGQRGRMSILRRPGGHLWRSAAAIGDETQTVTVLAVAHRADLHRRRQALRRSEPP